MIDLKNVEKLAKFRDFVCNHKQFKAAWEGIQLCMHQSSIEKRHIGCLLIGEGGVGKSTICQLIERMHEEQRVNKNNMSRLIVPVFYFPVPAPCTIKNLTIRMLEALKCDDYKGTASQLNFRLRTLLKECQTKLIMLDEFHHVYTDSDTPNSTSTNVANWIKTLGDETKICICLAGLPKTKTHLLLDPQMKRRYLHEFKLDTLSINNNAQSSLQLFLKQIEAFFNDNQILQFRPHLTSSEIVEQIDNATSGFPSKVIDLVHFSCINALNRSSSIVENQDFHKTLYLQGLNFEPKSKNTILFKI